MKGFKELEKEKLKNLSYDTFDEISFQIYF